MKIITISNHPEYWGSAATDAQAERWAAKMAICAERAGFTFSHTENEGTTDASEVYHAGDWDQDEYEISHGSIYVDWFARWCAHGFRGMAAWLKKQV